MMPILLFMTDMSTMIFGNPVKPEKIPEFIQNPPRNWRLVLEYKSPKVWRKLKRPIEETRIYLCPP